MSGFLSVVLASLAALVVENVIFTTAFGTSTLIELSKKHWNILSFGGFITEFAVLSSIISYLFEGMFINNPTLSRFLPSLYILSLGTVYIFTLLAIWFISRRLFRALKKYVHLSAFNCTVLSALFNNTLLEGTFWQRVLYAAQIGIGFALAAYLLYANYDKLNSEDIPKSFRGFPIYILYIGIISMLIYTINR